MNVASWVIVSKATGKAVLETFEKRTADLVNRERYDVVEIMAYLQGVNRAIKLENANV